MVEGINEDEGAGAPPRLLEEAGSAWGDKVQLEADQHKVQWFAIPCSGWAERNCSMAADSYAHAIDGEDRPQDGEVRDYLRSEKVVPATYPQNASWLRTCTIEAPERGGVVPFPGYLMDVYGKDARTAKQGLRRLGFTLVEQQAYQSGFGNSRQIEVEELTADRIVALAKAIDSMNLSMNAGQYKLRQGEMVVRMHVGLGGGDTYQCSVYLDGEYDGRMGFWWNEEGVESAYYRAVDVLFDEATAAETMKGTRFVISGVRSGSVECDRMCAALKEDCVRNPKCAGKVSYNSVVVHASDAGRDAMRAQYKNSSTVAWVNVAAPAGVRDYLSREYYGMHVGPIQGIAPGVTVLAAGSKVG